jgi:hypothetical protein
VDGVRASARARAEPVADEVVIQEERAPGATLVGRSLALGHKRAVRDADRRQVQDRAEVQGEAGSARMVKAGPDEQHVRLPEGADRRLQQGFLTES